MILKKKIEKPRDDWTTLKATRLVQPPYLAISRGSRILLPPLGWLSLKKKKRGTKPPPKIMEVVQSPPDYGWTTP